MAELRPPYNVSPLIKLTRWSLLFAGIAWGAHRLRVNTRKEEEHQAYLDKMVPIWMEKKRQVLANVDREQMLTLAESIGQKPPADFDKKYPRYEV